jgi:hypothetical protein
LKCLLINSRACGTSDFVKKAFGTSDFIKKACGTSDLREKAFGTSELYRRVLNTAGSTGRFKCHSYPDIGLKHLWDKAAVLSGECIEHALSCECIEHADSQLEI